MLLFMCDYAMVYAPIMPFYAHIYAPCGIFFMDPATMGANSGSDPIVMAQMAISADDAASGSATAQLQGRNVDADAYDWVVPVTWTW